MNSRKRRRDAFRAKQIRWEDVWELPLHLDKHDTYAYAKNGTMALTFESNTKEEILEARKIVAIINGEAESDRQHEYIHDGCAGIFCDARRLVFSVRGYGYLTGTGGLHLPWSGAIRVQDDFIAYILKRLNGE